MTSHDPTRRAFIRSAGSLLLLPAALRARTPARAAARELAFYVGTYTSGRSEGIYRYRLSLSDGGLRHEGTARGVVNPSFLALGPRGRHLYAVNEVEEFGGKPSGAVSAFAVDPRTGDLRLLNQQPSMGGAPCYLTVDRAGRFVLVANYVGGNVAVLPVRRDGSLGAATDVRQHEGSGADPERQGGPHAHCVLLDRANRYAFAADLGIDRVMVYRFDARAGKLAAGAAPWAAVRAGAGPRHFTFHPDGRHAYVINELDSTLTVFRYDAARGALTEVQTTGTLPPGFSGKSYCADVHVSPSGRFLYGSNRGHDSIVVFAVDAATGRLTPVQHEPTRGSFPRNFAIDPTGAFLLVANQRSDNIVTFRIDPSRGTLRPAGRAAEVPSPVCLKFR